MPKKITDPELKKQRTIEGRRVGYQRLRADPERWKNYKQKKLENAERIKADKERSEKLRKKSAERSWIIRNTKKIQFIKQHSKIREPDISRIWDESDKLLPESLRLELQNKRLQTLNEY